MFPPTPIPAVQSNIDCSCCFLQFSHGGSQPGQHAALGHSYRPDRHPEFLRGVCAATFRRRRSPKTLARSPGGLHLALVRPPDETGHDATHGRTRPYPARRRRAAYSSIACRSEPPVATTRRPRCFNQLMTRLRATRRSQPRNEPHSFAGSQRSMLRLTARSNSCITSRASASCSPCRRNNAVNHGLIKSYELDPRLVIFRITQAKQQAGAGGRGECHGRSLPVYTIENAGCYTGSKRNSSLNVSVFIPPPSVYQESDGGPRTG